VWTLDPWQHQAQRSEMRTAIWLAFKEAAITIAYPQLDLHLDLSANEALRSPRAQ